MNCGSVHTWAPDPSHPLGGRIVTAIVPLPRLDEEGDGAGKLWGRFVRVRNGGALHQPDPLNGPPRAVPIGDAMPNRSRDFIFDSARGGGRMDKKPIKKPKYHLRYIQAAHFGEVNTYYHLDRIACYVDELLHELGAPSLPRVVAVVNAHHGATEVTPGVRDGVHKNGTWLPFQGGHYRLPSAQATVREWEPISPQGEIHLGPGWRLVEHGALVEATGRSYRANAAHNAGILYHEYGHHLCRHTADFRANVLRNPDRQSNRKTAMEEGVCDYWAATMLGTPHIWAWHHRHDGCDVHPRSLVSRKTTADCVAGPGADPHEVGTIWAAALWDLRSLLSEHDADGTRRCDLLLVQALLLIGRLPVRAGPDDARQICRARKGFETGLACLLQADEQLYAGRHRALIESVFLRRGIISSPITIETPQRDAAPQVESPTRPGHIENGAVSTTPLARLARHVAHEDIPDSSDLMSGADLDADLAAQDDPPWSLVAVGDIMLGGRARRYLVDHGPDYPFAAVLPLLRRAPVCLASLEGPLAQHARKQDRNFSYRVRPDLASSLARAGINVVTLANNHLMDCGRGGVRETLQALDAAGVAAVGAGLNKVAAHQPRIVHAGSLRIGLLAYYWNRRTEATTTRPGSARDSLEELESDIRRLRPEVDRIVLSHHWGVPYVREPSEDDRAKARFAVDRGADAVIGHHPHIVQPFEVYKNRPIFYSLGNFAFGSGNSRAESILVGLRFEADRTLVHVHPIYVKNRDPRAAYQPKALRGVGATRALRLLVSISGGSAHHLRIERGRAIADLPWSPVGSAIGSAVDGR